MRKKVTKFDSATFLANAGLGRTIIELMPQQTFYCQGDVADAVFYLQKGRARLTVVSQSGKEATITLLSAGDFVGEASLAAIGELRLSTATAVNTCTALRISRNEMIRVIEQDHIEQRLMYLDAAPGELIRGEIRVVSARFLRGVLALELPAPIPSAKLCASGKAMRRHAGSGRRKLEAVASHFSPPALQASLQTSTFQARNGTTGAVMSVIHRNDVQNHLHPPSLSKIHLVQPESQPDATGFFAVEADTVKAHPSAFAADFTTDHSSPGVADAPAIEATVSIGPPARAASKSVKA